MVHPVSLFPLCSKRQVWMSQQLATAPLSAATHPGNFTECWQSMLHRSTSPGCKVPSLTKLPGSTKPPASFLPLVLRSQSCSLPLTQEVAPRDLINASLTTSRSYLELLVAWGLADFFFFLLVFRENSYEVAESRRFSLTPEWGQKDRCPWGWSVDLWSDKLASTWSAWQYCGHRGRGGHSSHLEGSSVLPQPPVQLSVSSRRHSGEPAWGPWADALPAGCRAPASGQGVLPYHPGSWLK